MFSRLRLTAGNTLTLAVVVVTIGALLTGSLGFLDNSTGWQLGFSVIPQQPSDAYWKTLGIATLNTVVLAAVAIGAATLVGSLIAVVSVMGNPMWNRLAMGYVQTFRNMPLILQALFWFAVITHLPGPRQAARFAGVVASNRGLSVPFLTTAGIATAGGALFVIIAVSYTLGKFRPLARRRMLTALVAAAGAAVAIKALGFTDQPLWSVPHLEGFNFVGGIHLPTELISVLIALSMFGSAYIAEIVRGGFATVPKGVIEAARALALPAWVIELKVRVPLALRAIILPLGSQYTTLIKATSIGLAVGFTDLFAVTLMSINQSGHTISLLCVMTACFVLLNQAVVSAANRLNKTFEIPGYGTR